MLLVGVLTDMARSFRSDDTRTGRINFLPRTNGNTIQRQPGQRFERCLYILYKPSVFMGGSRVRRGHEEQFDGGLVSEQEW